MLSLRAGEVDDVRWAFWRRGPSEPRRALPDDVGLPTTPRHPAAPADRYDDDADRPDAAQSDAARADAGRASRPTPAPASDALPDAPSDAPLTARASDVDRDAVAAAGAHLAELVHAVDMGGPLPEHHPDDRSLAVAATAALAARLPALSGVAGDLALDEPAEELLHAYAELLATRAQRRRGADRDDLLAVAHLAAAAVAVDAAGDPALLLLAGVPADRQARAAATLLAQTADDGGDPPDRLDAEVRALFAPPG